MTLGSRGRYYEEDYDDPELDPDYDDPDYDDGYDFGAPAYPPGRAGDLSRYRPASASPRRFWARLLAGVLAIVVALWALALTAQQLTSPEVAIPAHERAIESLTGLSEVLLIHEQEIRAVAAALPPNQEIEIPGFPVVGVTVTAGDIQGATVEEWHEFIVSRAAEVTYVEGAEAFNEAGIEPQGGFLSATNALVRLLGSVSADRHEQLGGWVQWLGIVSLALAAGMLVVGEGVRRFVPAGMALIAAGVLVALASLVAMGLVIAAGHEGGVLASELTSIASTYARAPLQNAIWLGLAGIVIVVPAHIGALLFDPRDRDDLDAEIRRAW